eukprot:TRINITY_DN4421_c0_g1_i12.p1 TRINITY_DN4421_c0_g1~~TRINITY_DN4421_c0_g1_i12.p1  ORF type:complete len:433 (-),score=99.92 TRINITY_DN4421_c0_g1_i12:35-1333(-)
MKNTFSDLEDSVNVWSDFLKAYIHPDSVTEFSEFTFQDNSFCVYDYGHLLCADIYQKEEICEKLHRLLEECDRLQGVQLFVDTDTGFGGMAEDFLELIHEELPRTPISLYSIYGLVPDDFSRFPLSPAPGNHRNLQEKKRINLGMSMAKLSELCTIYVPLSVNQNSTPSFPWIRPDFSKPFHTSALIATGLHTITCPFRTNEMRISNLEFCSTFASNPKANICGLNLALPLPVGPESKNRMNSIFEKGVSKPLHAAEFMGSLSLGVSGQPEILPWASHSVMCFKPEDSFFDPTYHFSNQKQLLSHFMSPIPKSHVTTLKQPFSIPLTFPQFFSPRVSENGVLQPSDSSTTRPIHIQHQSMETPQEKKAISSCSVLAQLFNGYQQHNHISSLVHNFKTILGHHEYTLSREDYEDLLERLFSLADVYDTNRRTF